MTFLSGEMAFDVSYFLRTREGCMPAVTEPREDYCQDHLYQIRLREAASDKNRVEVTATAKLA